MNPGLSPEVQQAMKLRAQGQPTGQLQQTSPGAAMSNPIEQPASLSSMNKASAPPGASPQPKFEPQNQEDMVVMALIEQLKNSNSLKKEQLKIGAPQEPQVPDMTAMGGGNPWGSSQISPSQNGSYAWGSTPDFGVPSMSAKSMQSGYPF